MSGEEGEEGSVKYIIRSGKVRGEGLYWTLRGLSRYIRDARRFDTREQAEAVGCVGGQRADRRVVRLLSHEEAKQKAVRRETAELRAKVEHMEALFQSTHHVHWSWVDKANQADGLRSALAETVAERDALAAKLKELWQTGRDPADAINNNV